MISVIKVIKNLDYLVIMIFMWLSAAYVSIISNLLLMLAVLNLP